jgi:hypothetical protein
LTDWAQITARSGNEDVWLDVCAQNKSKVMSDPWYMPDGRTSVWPFVEGARLNEIPFPVWFAPYGQGKRFGDMLWTGGSVLKIASIRMIEALEAAGITGYRTFGVDVRDHSDSPVADYVGFATVPAPGTDIQNFLGQDVQNSVFVARWHVVEALRAHGADKLDIQAYDPSQYDRE